MLREGLTSRASERWREAPPLADLLAACCWLDSADAPLHVETMSSSHDTVLVTAEDGRSAVVKCVPRHAADQGRTLAREMFVYRMAAWMADVAAVAAQPIFIDERRHVLVLEFLPHEPARSPGTMPALAHDASAALGCALARFHRATRGVAAWPSPSLGVFGIPDSLADAQRGRSPTTQSLMRAIADDGVLAPTLRRAAAVYASDCLIHGDLRRENWILDRRASPPALKMLDWEFAGRGDPAWDLGCVIAEQILCRIREAPGESSGFDLPHDVEANVRALSRAYSETGGVFAITAAGAPERLALCVIGRLLHVACEVADQSMDLESWPLRDIVDQAAALARAHDTVGATLSAWMDAS